jgi:hypothetical protein
MSESLVAVLPGVQQFLDRHHGLWIEGRQTASDSEKRLNVFNPATGEVIASTADASVDDVDRAVMSGWRAFVGRRWAGNSRQNANVSCCILLTWWSSTAKSWRSWKRWSREID